MKTVWLGEVGYREALDLQFDYVDRRATRKIPDTLLLLTLRLELLRGLRQFAQPEVT